MKDCNKPIRTAFFNRIIALGYSCYDQVDEKATSPYCFLYNQSSYEDDTQDGFGQVAFISVDIYKEYQKNFGGNKDVDAIADAIMQNILQMPPNQLSVSSFGVVACTLEGNEVITTTNATHTIFIRTLRFKLIIYEL